MDATSNPNAELILARAYAEVYETRAGAIMIADLETRYGCNPFNENSNVMSRNCGSLAVLQYIGEMITKAGELTNQARQESTNG